MGSDPSAGLVLISVQHVACWMIPWSRVLSGLGEPIVEGALRVQVEAIWTYDGR